LLDSPPCTNGTTCYAHTTPVVLHNGVLLTKVGSYYTRASDSKQLVNNAYSHFTNKSVVHSNASRYNSATGLYYDNDTTTKTWWQFKDSCTSKGMRGISIVETTYVNSSFIPNQIHATWTVDTGSEGIVYWYGVGLGGQVNNNMGLAYTRCVVSP